MQVTLEWSEVLLAANTGVMRRIASVKNARIKDQMHDPHGSVWDMDIEGAAAEMACAKALGRYWNAGVNTFKGTDMGRAKQIRWTPKSSNSLIIRDEDSDTDIYILVTGKIPTFNVAGWILGKDGKQAQWKRDANGVGKPAYFIPQGKLYTAESVPQD